MNTHNIELPPLPEPYGYFDNASPGRSNSQVRDAQRTAIEADRKKFGRNVNETRKSRGSIVNNASTSSRPVACFKCGHAEHGGGCVNVAPPTAEPVNSGWCEGCTPDDCCGCGPHKPTEHGRSEPGVSTTQALITLGKVIAGYQPGEEGWTKYDQQAYDAAMSIPQPLNESDMRGKSCD